MHNVVGIIVSLIYQLFSMIRLAILVYCVMSFLPAAQNNTFFYVLEKIVAPILAPVRALLNLIPGYRNLPIDLSPIGAFLLLSFVERLLILI